MSRLIGRPAPTGGHLVARSLLLLAAVLLASTPLSLLLDGSAWLQLTAAAAGIVIVSGMVLRMLVPRPALVPVLQLAVVALLVLVMELSQGLVSLSDLPLRILTAQADILPAAAADLTASMAPVVLGARATVLVVLLLALGALVLDLVYVDLGWHTPVGLALLGTILLPALQVPTGGGWLTVAGPVLAAALILGTRTLHPDPVPGRASGSDAAADALHPAASAPRPPGTLTAPVGPGAVTAIAAVLVAALALPLGAALPQLVAPRMALSMDLVNQWQNRDLPRLGPVMIDDDVSVRRTLLDQGNTEVLRYTTDAAPPGYLRVRTLNSFDGETFRATGAGEELDVGATVFSDARADGTLLGGTGAETASTRIEVLEYYGDRLPVPANIRSLETAEPSLAEALTLRATPGEVDSSALRAGLVGLEYTVTSEDDGATADELRAVDPAVLAQPLDAGYTDASEVPEVAVDLADQIAADAGAETAFDTALAYQEYFRGFRYSLTVQTPAGEDPLESFLADRIGYCEQFASVFALMMTSQGYPTRVVIGFTAGSQSADGWTVRSSNAHAWPEVWFGPEHGWVRFEPTPSAAANGVTEPGFEESATGGGASEPTAPVEDTPTEETPSETPSAEETESAEPTESAATASDGGGALLTPENADRVEGGLLLTLTLAALGATAAVGGVVLLRRRRMRRRDGRWAAFLERAGGVGTGGVWAGTGGGSGGGGAAAIETERLRRGAGRMAWSEVSWELRVRTRVMRLLGWTGAWGKPPRPLELDRALPPREALADLLDQIAAGDQEVTAEHRAAADRIAAAHTAARYAAPLPEPGDAGAEEAGVAEAVAGEGADGAAAAAAASTDVASAPDPEAGSGGAPPTQHPLRDDADLLIALIRRAR
ncbi:transglutaminase family protein [Brachybacterium sp. J153]|uniref:transglutaminase family protein n=1 Tax=Brachybacterium sp. J153 TaxID=3116488 RepID=UPI002E79E2A0|nr:transglutaminaseTgpA domain-containing protein [Brachybacterium sp. J153]MEE1617880.1 transglutaminaseTgpA domain-containing protein [Brachybacterium sp. J153]